MFDGCDNVNNMHKRLKQLREDNNFTQKQVSDYLKIDQSYLSKIEKGERNLSDIAFNDLCLLYNCSPSYLLGESDEYEPPKLAFRADEKVDLFTISKMNQIINHLKSLRELEEEFNND